MNITDCGEFKHTNFFVNVVQNVWGKLPSKYRNLLPISRCRIMFKTFLYLAGLRSYSVTLLLACL